VLFTFVRSFGRFCLPMVELWVDITAQSCASIILLSISFRCFSCLVVVSAFFFFEHNLSACCIQEHLRCFFLYFVLNSPEFKRLKFADTTLYPASLSFYLALGPNTIQDELRSHFLHFPANCSFHSVVLSNRASAFNHFGGWCTTLQSK